MSVATGEAAKPAAEVAGSASKSTRSVNGAKPSDKTTKTEKETGAKPSEKANETDKEAKASAKPTAARREYYVSKTPFKCGLENDGTVPTPYVPPKRITTSQATPDEVVKYQKLIDMCLHPDTIVGKRAQFDPNDIMYVMIEVQPYLASEPVLIEDVPFGVTIVGDLHGQLYDLNRVFKIHEKDGKPGYLSGMKFLFMGDYVDRGQQSLEVIMLLFCLKMLYPDNFFLLRGNHEFVKQNNRLGFWAELRERYIPESVHKLFPQINETFCYLSLAAIVGDSYFCVHAGISPRQFTRHELRGLAKPMSSTGDDFLVQDMLWSDPAVGLRGTVFNYERGCSVHFGLDALVHALHSIGCKALFRGHKVMTEGFDNQWDCCLTVFSSTSNTNKGAAAVIHEDGHCQVHILQIDPGREELDAEIAGGKPEEDELTKEDVGNGQTSCIMSQQ